MTDDTGARARSDRDTHQPVAGAADAVRLAPRYVAAVIDRHPTQITGVAPTDEGWIVEAEVVEDRRIPSTADILALYDLTWARFLGAAEAVALTCGFSCDRVEKCALGAGS